VSDEAKAERARKLVQPMLEGSFARIKDRVKNTELERTTRHVHEHKAI